VRPDGKMVIAWTGSAAGWDTHLMHLWEATTGKRIGQVSVPGTFLDAWAFRPDGKAVATVARENQQGAKPTVRLWDTANGQAQGGPVALGGPNVLTLGFRADGVPLVVTSVLKGGKAVRVWDGAAGQPAGPPLHPEQG